MAPTNMNVSHYIPDDVAVSTILSKLPIKSLKRFTCVRKSWALLFENARFMKMFSDSLISRNHPLYYDTCLLVNQMVGPNYKRELYLISGEKFENKVKLELPPQSHLEEGDCGIHILGSAINGIICLYQGDHTKSLLWNPTTKQVKVIPPSLAENNLDLTTDFTLHGFGYDCVRDDYTIIQYVDYYLNPIYLEFEYFEDDEEFDRPVKPDPFWEIYSLRSNSWRKLDVDMPTRYLSFECAEVYLNGVCHWWGKTDDETYIVSFNLSNEVFFTTPLHFDVYDGYESEKVERHLVVLNGYVALISNYIKTTSFHISVLGELGVKESWLNLYHFDSLPGIEFPIGSGKKGDIFFRKEDDDKLVCFDLIIGEIKEVGLEVPCHYCQITVYKKNLLPIGGINN